MESVVVIFAIIIFACIVGGAMSAKNDDVRDSTAGRWGYKAGKVARGEFGGKKWGERED